MFQDQEWDPGLSEYNVEVILSTATLSANWIWQIEGSIRTEYWGLS